MPPRWSCDSKARTACVCSASSTSRGARGAGRLNGAAATSSWIVPGSPSSTHRSASVRRRSHRLSGSRGEAVDREPVTVCGPVARIDGSRRGVGCASGEFGCVTSDGGGGTWASSDLFHRGRGRHARGRDGDASGLGRTLWRRGPDAQQRRATRYSRDELERLRFVVDLVEAGTTPADAHRLLAERVRTRSRSVVPARKA